MRRFQLEMAITGPGLSPEEVTLRDLLEVLGRIERAVSTYLDTCSEAPAADATLSLVGIRPGSDCLVFSVPETLGPPLAQLSGAIGSGRYDDLPRATHLELQALSESLTRRGWGFEIHEAPEQGILPARIDSTRPVGPPASAASVQGSTTLFGRCLRVGGVQPKAELRLPTGRLLNVGLTENLAKELAPRLYEEVVLEGSVTWNCQTWDVENFVVTRITSFRRTDPELAFKELAEATHGVWDGVDALAYVRELRFEN